MTQIKGAKNLTSSSNGGLDEGVQLFVSSNGKLKMSWGDSLHLEIFGSISRQLKNFSSQVLQDSSRVDSGSSTNTSMAGGPVLEMSVDTSYWEL